MKAAVYRKFGSAEDVLKIVDVTDQPPARGEVRVRIHASGVNPSDVKNRAGVMSSTMPFEFVIPHNDGAGVVESTGDGVDPSLSGKRMWVWNAQFRRQFGTAAEYVTLPANQVVPLPDRVSFEEGACLGVPALTAYRAISCGQSVAGQTVFVAGGSGAVGRYAVQFARAKGAKRIIATVGDSSRASSVEKAGADLVLSYHGEDLARQILDANGGRGVDRIVEVEWGLNAELDLKIIRPEGEIYVYGSGAKMVPSISVQQLMMTGVTMHFRSVFLLPPEVRKSAIDAITDYLDEGVLTHEIASVLPFGEIAKAHNLVEKRSVRGRVIVSID